MALRQLVAACWVPLWHDLSLTGGIQFEARALDKECEVHVHVHTLHGIGPKTQNKHKIQLD